jgi:catechol 2,3-dioxygenase-like lactoylglutathione lyase family enzyme
MSEQPPAVSGKEAKRQAKADMAAAKARSKAERPWYKKKRFIIPLALLLLVVIVLATSGGDDDAGQPVGTSDDTAAGGNDAGAEGTADEEDLPEDAPDDAEFARIGEEARDGQFAFVVDDFECVGDTIEATDEFLDDAEAQGQFCLLTLTAENIGDAEQSLAASNQYLYDSEERRFSASDDFEVILALDTPIYDSINPGNSMTGTIVFDVPDNAEIEFAELHDSALSGGVLVDLR